MPTNDPALDAQLARLEAVCATLQCDPSAIFDLLIKEMESAYQEAGTPKNYKMGIRVNIIDMDNNKFECRHCKKISLAASTTLPCPYCGLYQDKPE